MDNITSKTNEKLLREYDQAGAITGAKIAKTDDGYVLVIQVAWKRGDLVVFNQRGKPRAWVSLDRLLSYLAEMVPSIKQFDLVLDEPLRLPAELMAEAPPAAKPASKAKPLAKVVAKPKPAAKTARKAERV